MSPSVGRVACLSRCAPFRQVWTLALLGALSGCRTPGFSSAGFFDDEQFMQSLEAEAGRLCESGRARTVGDLRSQLDRTAPVAVARLPRTLDAARDWADLYDRRCGSVLVLCRIYKCEKCPKWHHASEGCAFVLTADGVCATARHSFDGADGHFLVAGTRDGRVLPVVEVLAASEADDIAIIRLDGGRLAPIPLRPGTPVGADVAVISHPRHHLYSFSTGVLARRATKYGGISGDIRSLERVPTPVLEITADFGVGSSGAPVLDRAGHAIGIAISTTTVYAGKKPDGDPQMTIHRCATAERILRLVRQNAR